MSTPHASAPGGLLAARPRSRLWGATKFVLGIAILSGLTYLATELYNFERREVTLDGVAIPAGEDPEPLVRELARAWYETEVTIEAGSHVTRASRRALGGRIDVERAVREAQRARGYAPIWERVWAYFAREPGALRWRRDVAEDTTREVAEALRREASLAPTAVDRHGHGGRHGLAVNLIGTTALLVDAVNRDGLFVSAPVTRVEAPSRNVVDHRFARYTDVVAAHETRYAPHGADPGRAINIEVAARYLDGAVVRPGEVLSFNEVVGERSTVRGFVRAVELAGGGRRVEGTGGGVCQVAATLFAAAFFAGFDVVEHHPHTRNSSYIQPGLDAAVSWPNRDVRVRNPFHFPIRVNATARQGRLRVSLLGSERGPRVEWSTRVLSRIARGVEREVVRSLPLGEETIVDDGEDGMVMERSRTVYWPDGELTERATLHYPVVHRLVRAGPSQVGP